MNTIMFGAAGFIGTNLALRLADRDDVKLTLVDADRSYFCRDLTEKGSRITFLEGDFRPDTDFDTFLQGQDVVFHLVSSTSPSTANRAIADELTANVISTAGMLDACVRCGVKKVIFFSSGGTVYGKDAPCPIREDTPTYPISSYGIQKESIEKLLYLYRYLHGLDYRVIRLANPYGPYQRPNGVLGVVTTFVYKALKQEKITVYGDGSVVRDFIYIDDAVRGVLNIAGERGRYDTYNLGSGYGTSVREVLETIERVLGLPLQVEYTEARNADVPVNVLDTSRYVSTFGALNPVSLEEGIRKTAEFLKREYRIEE
ncbi:MAG: NAD-dependent epimerase/dehydratase family protein [Lachnospiraceae bacterium]|jgi:UDP-glucose 4-epimerase|nr:NAD-dependent epimerase/dehydratase family protein [Lachnospiraceae bacterium]